jgi:hypothetical protein
MPQAGMRKRNATVSADKRIEFRVGVHQGDVVIEDDDILGDTVNVAARLEGLAEPGRVCVSARVRADAAGKLDLAFEDLGQQQLKNIARPVRVYRIRADRVGAAAVDAQPDLALPGQTLDCGNAVPEYERRPRAGIFCRRHARGDHNCLEPYRLADRDRSQQHFHLQGRGDRRKSGPTQPG